MKRRMLSLLLAMLLTVGLLPVTALAAKIETDEAIEIPVGEEIVANTAETPEIPDTPPTAITVEYTGDQKTPDGKLIGKTGDTFPFRAVDQNGNETPVTWKNGSTWAGSLDENGVFTAGSLSSGGSSTLYLTATSTLNESVKTEGRFSLCGYQMSQWSKTPTVALSEDGQTAKTISTSGGYDGSTVWTYEGAEGIAKLSEGQDLSAKKSSLKFDALRPGIFTASFALDFNETMTDTATLTITGVAVETAEGGRGKTYLTMTADAPAPTVQLAAYTAPERTVARWISDHEEVATVDENGLVTARGVGTALISAVDSEGARGGIKVVVQSGETPYFENLQFLKSALSDWEEDTFSATKLDYSLTIRAYSTTKLTFQATTLYDSEKYAATAVYPSIDGEERQVEVNSGKITYLEDIPFDAFDVAVTLTDKENGDNKTVYTFHVTRPRDTTQTIKSSGAVLQPEGRALSAAKYNGYAEGTMFQLNDDGSLKLGWGDNPSTGVTGSQLWYKCYALDELPGFSLNLTGGTAYTHLRYSTDGGAAWIELPQGGGATDVISFPEKPGEGNAAVLVTVNILDDKTYTANVKNGKDGFADSEGTTYTVLVEQVTASPAFARLLTAETAAGNWYPAFTVDAYAYTVSLPFGSDLPELRYTVSNGATVKLGSYNAVEQTPDADGSYTLALTASSQTLTVTSADGEVSNTYTFQAKSRLEGAPDQVTDYLCINSQYTNGGFGSAPQGTLAGGMVSLGNFGGYITYYYENGLRDDPANPYGLDFYVEGNANKDSSTSTKTSFFEPAQVWVSEDGETWYALAGSAHYDDGVDWNYTVTYTKAANGKTAWTDNHGNSNSGKSYTGVWPSKAVYSLNGQVGQDAITLSGVALPARSGEIAVSGQAVDAYPTQWGYADCQVNGTENPYLDNSDYGLAASGFDLAWAVDENGLPVDVSEKEFHYVKLQTASNIWHASFGEKSPEVSAPVRAEAHDSAVGKTTPPAGITITDGANKKTVVFAPGQQVYDVELGDMKYVSLSVDGAAEEDNVYLNNSRLTPGEALSGVKVTKEDGPRMVRLLVQNGDKEPVICLLRLTSTASASGDLIEGIKLNVAGSARTAKTADGAVYTASVGYRIDKVEIVPVAAAGVHITVNGQPMAAEYSLEEGDNTFALTAEQEGMTQTVTLRVTREARPVTTGQLSVYFKLLGDSAHGEGGEIHTLSGGGLETWIAQTRCAVDAPATVLDVLEAALGEKHTFVNADGNYISEIDGLAEFANGANSGWMYTLNGKYPDKGVAEQAVRNGDRIVFHYTDDYTMERSAIPGGNNGGGSSATNGAPETPQEEAPVKVFADVPNDHWAKAAIDKAVAAGLMKGTSATTFAPDASLTREMLATVLYRAAGAPRVDGVSPFADVQENAWYTSAVIWADQTGLLRGYGNGLFGVGDPVSREMLNVVMARRAGEMPPWTGDAALSVSVTRAQVAVQLLSDPLDAALADTARSVYQTVASPQVGSVGGEWAVLGLARSGCEVPKEYYEDYFAAVEKQVRACGGVLHDKKYTEYSRVIVALSAMGRDARNVAGCDLTLPLGDYDKTVRQGVNGPIWALIALDSQNYPMPQNPEAKTQATRQRYVDRILEAQLPGGGWSLTGREGADPDLTGMALQALAKYQDQSAVRQAIENALTCMSKQQNAKGGFSSGGTETSESCVQMLVALGELGIPLDDPRFVKNGRTLLDALLTYYVPGGGFRHTMDDEEPNLMATEQGLYGLAAAKRLRDGQSSLYRMDDVISMPDDSKT